MVAGVMGGYQQAHAFQYIEEPRAILAVQARTVQAQQVGYEGILQQHQTGACRVKIKTRRLACTTCPYCRCAGIGIL
jgi:hypothetical protein